MIGDNLLPPSPYRPDAAAALVALAEAISDPKKLKELLAQFALFDGRITAARNALENDRAAFAKQQEDWHKKSGREWDELQQKIQRELEEHNKRMADAERDIKTRDEGNKQKWANLVKTLTEPVMAGV